MKPGIYRLICPCCKKEVLENTEKFTSTIPVNGTMFRKIKGKVVKSRHDPYPSVRGQNFQCPMCMMPVCTPGGNVRLRDVESGDTFMSNKGPDMEQLPEVAKVEFTPLNELTVKELRKIAKEIAIPGYLRMRKPILLAAIERSGE